VDHKISALFYITAFVILGGFFKKIFTLFVTMETELYLEELLHLGLLYFILTVSLHDLVKQHNAAHFEVSRLSILLPNSTKKSYLLLFFQFLL